MNRPILAIVVPCYNEEDIVDVTQEKLLLALNNLVYKDKISAKSYLFFVDDGSDDTTWDLIKCFNKDNPLHIKGCKLSRNYGHQYALYAGIINSNSDIIITIDADLQDDINSIETMVDKYLEGYDIVYGVRQDRTTDNFLKKITADIYYKIVSLANNKTVYQHADFRLISSKIVQELKKIKESNLYLRGIIPTLGFKSTCVYYRRLKRIGGLQKYNLLKSIILAVDGITSFSSMPIKLITSVGLFCFVISIFMTVYAFISYFENKVISGWSSLFISIYFLGGSIIFSIGVIGEYISKIYVETKRRPRYIIEEALQ